MRGSKASTQTKSLSNCNSCCEEKLQSNCPNNDSSGTHNKSEDVISQATSAQKLYRALLRNDIQDSLGCLCLHYSVIFEVKLRCMWRSTTRVLSTSLPQRKDDSRDLFSVMTTVKVKQDHC